MFAAFASPDGTKFRVINLLTLKTQQEVARGYNTAKVTSISMTPCDENSWYLAAATEKSTVHVFTIKIGDGDS